MMNRIGRMCTERGEDPACAEKQGGPGKDVKMLNFIRYAFKKF